LAIVQTKDCISLRKRSEKVRSEEMERSSYGLRVGRPVHGVGCPILSAYNSLRFILR
jgi:hypothetical protein